MTNEGRPRLRDLGVAPGLFPTGSLNAITDVPGVTVGHLTRIEGQDIRTGVTVVRPHPGNTFQDKVPAGLAVANGFGKLIGATQLCELGEIETPIVLTNTLSAPEGAKAIIAWTLEQPGNEAVKSVNPVVGETNDGILNAIRRRIVTPEDVLVALNAACGGPVTEGAVGAGTGTIAYGLKAGIGNSSRQIEVGGQRFVLGVLVHANHGGALRIGGAPIAQPEAASSDGSIVILAATDAPLGDRNLRRLASRTFAGLARTGADFAHGSGDYAIAFSTADTVRRTQARRAGIAPYAELSNDLVSPLFSAVADATEEAVCNALLQAWPMSRVDSSSGAVVQVPALDIATVRRALGDGR